ncbi:MULTISPECIES: hypothetical protein [Brevundimonas]|uniref:hypothetical protein n=1 Tax=Brevundimonas sp. TaxID=1871086 RepID=UPI0019A7E8B1|nr:MULTISPECIES: hypothetical protein [Brevundimonas]MBD3817794.1 hypothetical protein [Brevundimonas diminuta]
MSDHPQFDRAANPRDVIERIRAERFPSVDADLVMTFLQLHASAEKPENLIRRVDEALAAAARGEG